MPRTIESIVHNHKVAAARRAANRPIWDVEINIKGILDDFRSFGDDVTAEQVVEIYRRLHAALKLGVPPSWLDHSNENFCFRFDEILETFANASVDDFEIDGEKLEPLDELNGWLDELYDWGDARRVWLG